MGQTANEPSPEAVAAVKELMDKGWLPRSILTREGGTGPAVVVEQAEYQRQLAVGIDVAFARLQPCVDGFIARFSLPECDHCEHWKPHGCGAYDQSPDGWGLCMLSGTSDGKPDEKLTKAQARDLERYYAVLWTHLDFGCVQFKAKAGD